MNKTRSIALAACASLIVLVHAGSASAGTQRTCPDISLPKCTIQLSTGITMRYLEVGPSNGPVVFLLHGYSDTSRSLTLVMNALHRLMPNLDIDPDLRGHGQSSLPAGAGCAAAADTCFQPIDFARDIVAFMDARHIRRATMVGHSMGTLVAQEPGLSYPQRVDKLVLISTATDGQSEPPLFDLLDGLIGGVWEPAFLAAGYSWPDGVYDVSPAVAAPGFDDFLTGSWDADAIADPAFLAQIVPETAATPLGTRIGALEAMTEADNTQRLEQLKPPTFVLWAVQDDIFSRAIEQKLIDGAHRRPAQRARSGGSSTASCRRRPTEPRPTSGTTSSGKPRARSLWTSRAS